MDAGATVPLIHGGGGIFPTSPPSAYDWYDVTVSIQDWASLAIDAYPQPGYIISRPDPHYPAARRDAHVGILDYDGSWINAGLKDVNKYPHLTNSDYQPPSGMRKYTGN